MAVAPPELPAPAPFNARERALVAAIVTPPVLMHEGEHLAHIDDQMFNLHTIRSGSFKGYVLDPDGREHVRDFFMPGQLIGLDAIQTGRHRSNVIALETSSICGISLVALTTLFPDIPQLSGYILRLMSKALAASEILAGDYGAEERCAAFITGLAEHFARLGWSPNVFNMAMSRRDIANHLRLAPETVTRIFSRFSKDGLINIKGRQVTLVDRPKLDHIASCMGPLSM